MNNYYLHRWWQLFMLVLILLLSSRSLLFAQEYRFDRWEAKDGLAQNSVKVIMQSSEGYLWLSTEGGLSRFDGVSFTNFGIGTDSAFKSDRVGTIYENENGDLLFYNYLAGILVYKNHKFYNISNSIDAEDKRVKDFQKCSKNHILLQTYNQGMSIINNEDYTEVKFDWLDDSEIPLKVICYKDYNVWVYKNRLSFKDQNLKPIADKPDMVFNKPVSDCTIDIESNNFWLLDDKYIYKYNGDELLSKYPFPSEICDSQQVGMLAKNGKLLLSKGNSSLIYRLNEHKNAFEIYINELDICPQGHIYQTFIDRENNVWFGTSTCGLIKMKPPRITYLDKDEWKFPKNFYPIVKGEANDIYLGGNYSGFFKIDSTGNYSRLDLYENPNSRTINSVEFHNGAVYFSSYIENHITKLKNQQYQKIYFPDSIYSQKNAIYSTPSGRLIASHRYGYLEIVDDKMVAHNIVEEPFIFISNFHETADGTLWVASSNKLLAFDKSHRVIYDSQQEIPLVNGFREISEDSLGRIMVGTYGHGFIIIDNGKTFQVNKGQGLSENVVSTITEDSKGNIWLTGNKGLSRLVKSEVLELQNGTRQHLTPVVYNEQTDRMRTSEFNGGHQHSKCRLSDDCYIFPTMNGAMIVDFAKLQETKLPAPVLIEKLVYNDKVFFPNDILKTDYTADRFDIYYTSNSFISPKQISFKYMLEGLDKNWNEVGNERKASYGKLPPGEYTFLVKSKNHGGLWSDEAAQFSFRIVPPFYKTLWFNIILIILIIGITGIIVNSFNQMKRRRSAKRQMMQLEAIVSTEERERKRIAADLHDGIGQLLSSIKINMEIVKDKILNEDLTTGMKLVDKSKKSIEEVMYEIRNISYNLRPPSLEQFGLTMAITEEVSKLKDKPDLHIHFNHATKDVKFDPKVEIVLFRVFQELLNNAITHAEPAEITIQLIQHSDSLLLMMEDDGNGFNLAEAYEKLDSSGLKNIFSRVKSIKGTIHIDSQPGVGANVTIEIPL